MARTKLTTRSVAALPAPDPSGRQVLHWDTELRGFGVLCSGATATKTYVVQHDLPGGKTRRVTLAPVNVLALDAARQRAKDTLADMYQGRDPKRGRGAAATTLQQALDDYIAARNQLRPSSQREYRRSVEHYLSSWLEWPLRDITPDMVEARHRAIASDVARAGRYSGAATANGVMRALRLVWNFAADDRLPDLPANPVRRLRRQWFAVPRRERLVTADQLPAFYQGVAALPNPVARDYLLLLLFTGLRREEAAGLRWEHVDFESRVIRLPAKRTKSGRKLDLPMSDFVRDLLVARRAVGNEGFVFPADSRSGYIADANHPLTLVALATGIVVSAHDLRRTYVTVAEGTDISPIALKALVNHSLGSDVTGGYVVMTTERLREPAQRVCDRLRALCKIPAVEGDTVAKLR